MYIIDIVGTAIIIPVIPAKLPPTVIASNTQIPGSPTDLPTTLGYIRLPSICCKTKNKIINQTDFIGETISIVNAPYDAAKKDPTKGIKENSPMIVATGTAFGILRAVILAKNKKHSITASVP